MFSNTESPHMHYPKLKGRAAELRHLGRPLLLLWRKWMDRGDIQHKQIEIALDCSARMEEIVSGDLDKFRLPERARIELQEKGFLFLTLFNALANHYSTRVPARKLFDITIKAHYLAHNLLQSQWIHPRLAWNYSGEDFMQHMKRIHARCTKGNAGHQCTMKFCSIYRIGLHCMLKQSRPLPKSDA